MSNISVIIPVYNRIQAISRALDSVYSQTLRADEVIVVDDGSDDGTAYVVKHNFPEVKLLHLDENKGVSAARNLGISQATGQWVALLDSDDEWLPNKLEEQWAAIQLQPKYKLIHSDEIWIRNGVRVNQSNKYQKHGGYIFEHCLAQCAISPSSVMIHRDVFDQIGVFDENLPACEDYDLWLRICSLYPVLYVDKPLLKKYGGHLDQLSSKYWGMDRFRISALEKILQTGNLSETYQHAARDMLIRKAGILLKGATKRHNDELSSQCEKLIKRYS